MVMNLIQIILVVFFMYATGRVFKRYRTGELTLWLTAAWMIFWLLACIVTLVPNSTSSLAKIVGVGRGADLVIYVSVAVLFFLLFRVMARIERLNKTITELTRALALRGTDASKLD